MRTTTCKLVDIYRQFHTWTSCCCKTCILHNSSPRGRPSDDRNLHASLVVPCTYIFAKDVASFHIVYLNPQEHTYKSDSLPFGSQREMNLDLCLCTSSGRFSRTFWPRRGELQKRAYFGNRPTVGTGYWYYVLERYLFTNWNGSNPRIHLIVECIHKVNYWAARNERVHVVLWLKSASSIWFAKIIKVLYCDHWRICRLSMVPMVLHILSVQVLHVHCIVCLVCIDWTWHRVSWRSTWQMFSYFLHWQYGR